VIIVFFILFCFVGPLIYHTNQSLTNPLLTDTAPSGEPPARHRRQRLRRARPDHGRRPDGARDRLLRGLHRDVIGTLYGAVAGLVGGIVDGVMMRFVDVLLSIPLPVHRARARDQVSARRCLARA
jgi:hypothetical protein